MVFLHLFQLYRGFWRYFGVRDLLAVLKAVLAGSLASVLAILLLFRFEGYSRSLFVVDAMAAFLLISGSRFLFRALTEARHFPGTGVRVLVLGVGDAGDLAVRLLRTMPGEKRIAVGFLDGDLWLRSRRILGVPVLGRMEDLERVARETGARELVIARALPPEEQRRLAARAAAAGLAVWLAPSATGFVRLVAEEPAAARAAPGHVLDIDHPESGR
jgi:UDP-GlcNAc:undecaprenyl-phosphate GlcNAc-1-phosphate transferase